MGLRERIRLRPDAAAGVHVGVCYCSDSAVPEPGHYLTVRDERGEHPDPGARVHWDEDAQAWKPGAGPAVPQSGVVHELDVDARGVATQRAG